MNPQSLRARFGFMKKENKRALPGAASNVRSNLPRPAVWNSVATTSPVFAEFDFTISARSVCVDVVRSTTLTRQYPEVSDAITAVSSGALGADVPTTSTVEP